MFLRFKLDLCYMEYILRILLTEYVDMKITQKISLPSIRKNWRAAHFVAHGLHVINVVGCQWEFCHANELPTNSTYGNDKNLCKSCPLPTTFSASRLELPTELPSM